MPKENQTKENKTADWRNRVRGALLGMDSKPGKERFVSFRFVSFRFVSFLLPRSLLSFAPQSDRDARSDRLLQC